MADRSNRESATREKQERKVDWKPPSPLDAPEAPVGYNTGGLEQALWTMMISQMSLNEEERDMN